MTRKPAPDAPAASAPETPAMPLPQQGGAWIMVDGQLVRDPDEPQAMPAADAAPENPPSTEA
jgi:hypothetical protein